jgi:hypothetical protein
VNLVMVKEEADTLHRLFDSAGGKPPHAKSWRAPILGAPEQDLVLDKYLKAIGSSFRETLLTLKARWILSERHEFSIQKAFGRKPRCARPAI